MRYLLIVLLLAGCSGEKPVVLDLDEPVSSLTDGKWSEPGSTYLEPSDPEKIHVGRRFCVYSYRLIENSPASIGIGARPLPPHSPPRRDMASYSVGVLEGTTNTPCLNGLPGVEIERNELLLMLMDHLGLGLVEKDGKVQLVETKSLVDMGGE